MALTAGRQTKTREGSVFSAPLAANTTVFSGSIVALDASGNLVPGQTSGTLKRPGLCLCDAQNTGAAGEATAEYDVNACAYFGNSTGGDLIDRTDIGADCFIVDDETVAKTNGAGARSVAGEIVGVDDGGVWVQFQALNLNYKGIKT